MTGIGKPLDRKENRRFLTGGGRFIADLDVAGVHDAVFVRSSLAHGSIHSIDSSDALAADGVVAVLTADDLDDDSNAIERTFYTLDPAFVEEASVFLAPYSEPLFARERVVRSGEALAMVVATDRAAAEDGRDLVFADIDPLEVVADIEAALEVDSPQIHPDIPGNLHGRFAVKVGHPEAVETGHSVTGRFRVHRSLGSPIENRGVIAEWSDGKLTVWSTTQIPHVLKSFLCEALGLSEESVRVAAPDVGGSFGGGIYPEEILVPWAAMKLGVPIRWLEDRTEQLSGSRHSRDQVIDATLSFGSNGKFEALSMRILQDCGAFNPFGITLPYNSASHARSVYRIDNFSCEALCVATNKTRNTPVRGAGRPEVIFVLERLIDMAAEETGIDAVALRRQNLIRAEEMPFPMGMLYRDGVPMVYDSGDFPAQFELALDISDYPELKRQKAEANEQGRLLGVGVATHVEGTGFGPHETAVVGVDFKGEVYVHTGAQPHGQGLETSLAQVCSEVLDLEANRITVWGGDTALTETGGGTFGSRSAVTAGSAVLEASRQLRDRALGLAATALGSESSQLELRDGLVTDGKRTVTFAELALVASEDEGLPLEATIEWTPPTVTFGSGTAVALVEVDQETGLVDVLEYTAVDDCGTVLNPAVVKGQLEGGVVHGLGNALLEEARYDDQGQFLTGSFMDYLLPTAMDVPQMKVAHRSHPTPLNPLGAKGVGEGTTSSAPAAIINAICDALGVQATEMPLTPERIRGLLTGKAKETAWS